VEMTIVKSKQHQQVRSTHYANLNQLTQSEENTPPAKWGPQLNESAPNQRWLTILIRKVAIRNRNITGLQARTRESPLRSYQFSNSNRSI